eukprot:1228958-Rhodomonas_salina.1
MRGGHRGRRGNSEGAEEGGCERYGCDHRTQRSAEQEHPEEGDTGREERAATEERKSGALLGDRNRQLGCHGKQSSGKHSQPGLIQKQTLVLSPVPTRIPMQ